jgi:hypothetical protein
MRLRPLVDWCASSNALPNDDSVPHSAMFKIKRGKKKKKKKL